MMLMLVGALALAAVDPTPMDDIARRHVELVLALGVHDRDYVDASYGPADWRDAQEGSPSADRTAVARHPRRSRREWAAGGGQRLLSSPRLPSGLGERRKKKDER